MRRYEWLGPAYDVVSLEWPVYRPARVDAVQALRLGPGQDVLDVGCGTGLSFGLLRAVVGSDGSVTAVDRSASMLATAQRRAVRIGGRSQLVRADAAALVDTLGESPRFDGALAAYSLSLMPDWPHAWRAMRMLVRPGGRIAVVDLDVPSDAGLPVRALARAACVLGGSDPRRAPWRRVEEELADVVAHDHAAGHVRVRVGTRP